MGKAGSENTEPRSAEWCAATAVGIAVLALAGWLTGARYLAGQWGNDIPMAPSTVLAFLLLGGALFTFARWPAKRVARFVALAAVSVVSVLALLVLAQWLAGVDLGVEPARFHTVESPGANSTGNMSPLTAALLLLESVTLFLCSSGLAGAMLPPPPLSLRPAPLPSASSY